MKCTIRSNELYENSENQMHSNFIMYILYIKYILIYYILHMLISEFREKTDLVFCRHETISGIFLKKF